MTHFAAKRWQNWLRIVILIKTHQDVLLQSLQIRYQNPECWKFYSDDPQLQSLNSDFSAIRMLSVIIKDLFFKTWDIEESNKHSHFHQTWKTLMKIPFVCFKFRKMTKFLNFNTWFVRTVEGQPYGFWSKLQFWINFVTFQLQNESLISINRWNLIPLRG